MTPSIYCRLILFCAIVVVVSGLPATKRNDQQLKATLALLSTTTTKQEIYPPENISCIKTKPRNTLHNILKLTPQREIARILPKTKRNCVGSQCAVRSRRKRMSPPTRCTHLIWVCNASPKPTLLARKLKINL